jgi:hypothetical protein
MALRREQQRTKGSESGTNPRGEAMLTGHGSAGHGSSVSTELRRIKPEFVSV